MLRRTFQFLQFAGRAARRALGVGRRLPGVRGCTRCGCALAVLIAAALACTLLGVGVGRASAAPEPSLRVCLLIDQSHSMFEMGGIGSDPDRLRIEAARLLISYLGVDSGQVTHRACAIFFGTEAVPVFPLTALSDDVRRAELNALLGDPPRMGWTDPVKAMRLAHRELFESDQTLEVSGEVLGSAALVMLTDGKPEWSNEPTPAETAEYIAALDAEARAFAERGAPIFIILLANAATDADPDIARVWTPVWQAIAGRTPPGAFFIARQAGDLTGIYHEIAAALTGRQVNPPVFESGLVGEVVRQPVRVEPGLARVTFVVSKSDPATRVSLLDGQGTPVETGQPGVRHAGLPGQTREEIWVIDLPRPGEWTVLLDGFGRVTVWKDFLPLPASPTPAGTATATSLPATATHTPPAPTATPSPTGTAVPASKVERWP